MGDDNGVLSGSDELASADKREAVFNAALAYVDALYSAKFARAMNPFGDVPPVKESQHRAIEASRHLVAVVGEWRAENEE